MTSLELLEARLDNLLSTALEETKNIDLFVPIRKDECSICFIPLPLEEKYTTFMNCCGKTICEGCLFKDMWKEIEKGKQRHLCAFCRKPTNEGNYIKDMKKLMKNNNPEAFIQMAKKHVLGSDGVFQSNTRALEMYIRAAELGSANGFMNIGLYHSFGDGSIVVEHNMTKARSFVEIAAKKGLVDAHRWLANYDSRIGNISTCNEHLKIAARAGDKRSMDDLMTVYKSNLLSKDELTQTLREHQASMNEMKSEDRKQAHLVLHK